MAYVLSGRHLSISTMRILELLRVALEKANIKSTVTSATSDADPDVAYKNREYETRCLRFRSLYE